MRAAPPTPRGEPPGKHLHDIVEFLAAELAVRIGGPHALIERRFVPLFAGRGGPDLLRQDVERLVWRDGSVEPPLPRCPQQRPAIDQLISRYREHASPVDRSEPVP